MKFAKSFGLLICFVGLISLAGCGKSKLQSIANAPMVPVQGKVTFAGKPLSGGNVFFHIIEGDKKDYTPQGSIDPQGNYVIETSGEKGAPAGKYRVTVDPANEDKSMDRQISDAQYDSLRDSPLIVTVQENAPAGTYDLKLEMAKRRP